MVRPPRSLRRRLAALATLGALTALVIWLFADDRFYVQTVAVEGARYSDRAAVLAAADLYGYHILWINAKEVAQRIEALPTVQRAEVKALFPNRARIRLVERQPVALWVHDGQAQWVDQEGRLLPVADPNLALPTLVDLDGSTDVGEGQVSREIAASVAELHRYLPQVEQFTYSRERGLHFTLPGGTTVVLGDSQQLEQRARHLVALQSTLEAQNLAATEIDLSQPGGYTMKLAP